MRKNIAGTRENKDAAQKTDGRSPHWTHVLKGVSTECVDRVSVPSRIAVDIFDGTQWRGTELPCTCFLCKSSTAYL